MLIPLHNSTLFTQISPEDEPLVQGRNWRLLKGYAYAYFQQRTPDGGVIKKAQALHRLVMGCSEGDNRIVDHINRDRLDNRRENLRFATHTENARNQAPRGRLKIRGISQSTEVKRWTRKDGTSRSSQYVCYRVEISVNGVSYRGGRYRSLEKAKANLAALRLKHGLEPPS